MPGAGLQEPGRALDVDPVVVGGRLDRGADARQGGEVDEGVEAARGEGLLHEVRVQDVAPHELAARTCQRRGEVGLLDGRGVEQVVEAVEDDHAVAVVQQALVDVGADEAGPTGEQDAHAGYEAGPSAFRASARSAAATSAMTSSRSPGRIDSRRCHERPMR